MKKMKVCRDSVHGYIHIPSEWFELFIDTPLFQRLRHIEQTSMRCLYPSARHDRFVHSLGTYHLGDKAFQSLERNADPILNKLDIGKEALETARNTFLAACLLHDCAHAPFSHTFEEYYDRPKRLDPELKQRFADDDRFADDLISCKASPHEKASALALIDTYGTVELERGWDPKLAARMVMGCAYHTCSDDQLKRFHNVLIALLNGNAIDVDKLDYIMRDTWASGVVNVGVDVHRLLDSVTLDEPQALGPRNATKPRTAPKPERHGKRQWLVPRNA